MNSSLVIFALACTVAAVYADGPCFKAAEWRKHSIEEQEKIPEVQECKAKGGSNDDIHQCCMNKLIAKSTTARKECHGKEGEEREICVAEKMGLKCDRTFEQENKKFLNMCLETRKKDVEEAISSCKSSKNVCICIIKNLQPICDELSFKNIKKN